MSGGPDTTSRVRRRWLVFGAIAVAVLVLDQVSKAWVEASFQLASGNVPAGTPGAPTPVVGDLVRIARSWNDGGIFGLFGQSATILGLASVAVSGIILWVEAHQGVQSLLLTVALGLLLGGALGNLLDRLRYGHVVDWVDTGLGSLRFYTFNVADSAISVAVVLLLAIGLLGPRLQRDGAGGAPAPDGSPVPDGSPAAMADHAPDGGHP